MLALRSRSALAVSLLVLCTLSAHAQDAPVKRDPHDSIDVAVLSFPGAKGVSTDDLKRLIYTRGSPCRLPFLIPLCKLTPSQLFTDRRRTTESALGKDITTLRVYYWQRGFREATVDTVLIPAKRGYNIAFQIDEGEATRISTLTVTQRNTVLSPRDLAEAVVIHEGEPLSLVALDTTLSRLHATVWNKGYGDVRIDTSVPRADASHLVPVRIDIDPRWITRVGSVDFAGNSYLSHETLQRGVLLQPGTIYTRNAVLESQKRLLQSPAIARALVITPAGGDSIKALSFAITETARRHAELALGFNTIDFGQAALEFRHNALGAGRWLRLHAVAGNLLGEQLDGRAIFQRSVPVGTEGGAFLRPTYQASLTLTQPWLVGARTSAAFTAFTGRRSLVGVVIDENAGVGLGVVRELAPKLPIGLNYRLETTRVQASAVYFCAGYGICDAPTMQAVAALQRLAPVGVSAWIDRSDDLEVPTRGFTAVFDAEHASSATGSTFAHHRLSADASYYRSFGELPKELGSAVFPKVLAIHGRAGFVRPLASDRAALGVGGTGEGILHPRARFYAGGMQSVRGFAENELGPRVLQVRHASLIAAGCTDATISSGQCDPTPVPGDEVFERPTGGSSVVEGSVELRVPLMKMLGGVVFLDGAYVGTNGLSSPAKGKGAITPGGGFRYRSPLGVLRLDVGLRPVGAEMLPVVAALNVTGQDRVVRLSREKRYSPIAPAPGTLKSLARRLVVHFAMGQAF